MVDNGDAATGAEGEGGDGGTAAAQRARAERNRQRARALREARLVRAAGGEGGAGGGGARELLSAGGFLLSADAAAGAGAAGRRAEPAPAPVPHRAEQPHCLHCDRPFPHSYLFDTFDYSVCDPCREAEGREEEHSLVTRTEAKSEFLLRDCDLDAREPPLRCVRRRNPHRARFAEMRLYLRAQVERRALDVWGSREALEAERDARRERQRRAAAAQERRRLRALRMDVRSSLFDRTHAAHQHAFGPERHDPASDTYERTCLDCGHVDVYEKM